MPEVFRSALVGLVRNGSTVPCIAVQPMEGSFPKSRVERNQFLDGLRRAAATTEMTRDIRDFVFRKTFPVDVRHNAKINRIELARILNREIGN